MTIFECRDFKRSSISIFLFFSLDLKETKVYLSFLLICRKDSKHLPFPLIYLPELQQGTYHVECFPIPAGPCCW